MAARAARSPAPTPARPITAPALDTINALGGNDTVNAGGGNDMVNGGTGNDTLNGDDGDDTFTWNANNAGDVAGNSDGRDIVNGGTEGGAGDTFVINGNARCGDLPHLHPRGLGCGRWQHRQQPQRRDRDRRHPGRNTDFANVIAELREIEEIRINGVDPSGAAARSAATPSQVIGDFSGTSLRLNTITIDGNAGDDTVDISALTSDHRIVFRSNGGNDTIIGDAQAAGRDRTAGWRDDGRLHLVHRCQRLHHAHQRYSFDQVQGDGKRSAGRRRR